MNKKISPVRDCRWTPCERKFVC